MPRKWHVRFLGGCGPATGRAYPTGASWDGLLLIQALFAGTPSSSRSGAEGGSVRWLFEVEGQAAWLSGPSASF